MRKFIWSNRVKNKELLQSQRGKKQAKND